MAKTVLDRGLRYNHEAIVDLMLQHPEWNQIKLAETLNCTPNRLSIVINTELFKDYYARRRVEHNKAISKGVADRVTDLANASLEKLKHLIVEEDEAVTPRLMLDTINVTTKALGMQAPAGANGSGGQNVQVNLNVDAALLERARQRLRANQTIRDELSAPRSAIEVIPQEG